MADWFIVRLPRTAEEAPTCVVTDAYGQLRLGPQRAPLEQLASLATGRRVCALVPGVDVLQNSAELPARSAGRTPQIVPFALEDQVADDIDTLHFATGRADAGSVRTPVDVVSRKLLEEWLSRLTAAAIVPEAMYADSELVPTIPGQVAALLESDTVVIRNDAQPPLVLPSDDPATAFELAGVPAPDSSTVAARPHLTVYADPVDWQRQARVIESLRPRFESLRAQLLPGGVLPFLAQQVPGTKAINLLQGPYAPAASHSSGLQRWRLAAALAAALVALHFLGQGLALVRLGKAERELDTQIEQAFRAAMPGERNSVDARRRMQRRLETVTAGAGERGGLLPLLEALADARSNSPGARLEALSFRDGALDLRVIGPDAESIEKINQALRGGGLQADVTAGNSRGATYEGRMQVKSRS